MESEKGELTDASVPFLLTEEGKNFLAFQENPGYDVVKSFSGAVIRRPVCMRR